MHPVRLRRYFYCDDDCVRHHVTGKGREEGSGDEREVVGGGVGIAGWGWGERAREREGEGGEGF